MNKNKISNLIYGCGGLYCIKQNGANTDVYLAFPYAPFNYKNKANVYQLDSYYLESNRTYHLIRKLQLLIERLGHKIEKNNNNIKAQFFKNNLCIVGHNSLCYFGEFGSFCVLYSFTILNINLKEISSFPPLKKKLCDNCNLCENKCQTAAINNGIVDPAKCIRSYMEGAVLPVEFSSFIGDKFMGCNCCQIYCPMNAFVKKNEPPQCVLNLFNKSVLEENTINNNLAEYRELIGTNLARQKIFTQNIQNINNYKNK